jgi:hypothetical protein
LYTELNRSYVNNDIKKKKMKFGVERAYIDVYISEWAFETLALMFRQIQKYIGLLNLDFTESGSISESTTSQF